MHAGDKHLVIDLGLRRQTPHRLHARVPVESIGLRVPRIATQANEIDCHLQPRLALAQTLLRYPERGVRRLAGIKVGQSQLASRKFVRASKMCGQHADRLAAPTVDERRRLYRAKPC